MKKRLSKLVKNSKYALSGFVRYGVLSQYKHVLIVGGVTPLGNSLVNSFQDYWKVANIDYSNNENAHLNILLNKETDLSKEIDNIDETIKKFSNQYEAIICTSEAWCTGSISDKSILNQYKEIEAKQTQTSLLAGHLASKYLTPNGLLVFTGGAAPFQKTNPKSLSYDVTKNMVHYLALNMAELQELNADATVVTILPEIKTVSEDGEDKELKGMNTEKDNDKIAKLLRMWADGKRVPLNGTYISLKKVGDKIVPEFF